MNRYVSWCSQARRLDVEQVGRRVEPFGDRRPRFLQRLTTTCRGQGHPLQGVDAPAAILSSPYTEARHASALALLRGGLTTIRAFAATFRNPGTVSDYCLAHHYRNPNYHPVHVRLLRHLRRITGDPWFGRMADLYAADVR